MASTSRTADIIKLKKDGKLISNVKHDSQRHIGNLDIDKIQKCGGIDPSGWPFFCLRPACCNEHQLTEWFSFIQYLQQHDKVAHVIDDTCEFYILPPENAAKVHYQMRCSNSEPVHPQSSNACTHAEEYSGKRDYKSPSSKHLKICANEGKQHVPDILPGLLKVSGHVHSSWIFGAIAELVDNARDASATKFAIAIKSIKKHGKEIPVLSAIDNGHGMSRHELLRMFSLGCNSPDGDDPSHIGLFGTGFKYGSMGIGQDAIVLTQTIESRSVGLFSQSYTRNKGVLETPIIGYCKEGPLMEFDTTLNSEAEAEEYLKAVKDFSHFNEYYIGALFDSQDVGTQVHIWNLKKYGSDYCLDWQDAKDTGAEGDITIRSVNCGPSEICKKAPLEYSLRSYLALIFSDSSMEISVQGSVVKTGSLLDTLYDSIQMDGDIKGKLVKLILGRSKLDHDQRKCGIFIYWHGRLIEQYKKVGGMLHNAEEDLGVIGVIDVTDLMKGEPEILMPGKQNFVKSATYIDLEVWLAQKVEEYANRNLLKTNRKSSIIGCEKTSKKQCDKCKKWRFLGPGLDASLLDAPLWYCFMAPYNKSCMHPESPGNSMGSKRCRDNSLPGESSTLAEDARHRHKRMR